MWTAIIFAVATMAANWIWSAQFPRAKAFVLLVGLIGWPLTVAIFAGVLAYVSKLCDDHFWWRAALFLLVLCAGAAVYGVPGPGNLFVSAVVSLYMGLKARDEAQDQSDLEEL